jgi:hypothetical protein
MAYDRELPGCFGGVDLQFAIHPLDTNRAFAWLIKLRERQALWSGVQAQIEEFLREPNAAVFHILDQVDRAKRMFGPWLYGPLGEE